MSGTANLFDGKSSRPKKVSIKVAGEYIYFADVNERISQQQSWKISDCRIQNLGSEQLLLEYGEFPYETLDIRGELYDKYADTILVDIKSIDKAYISLFKVNRVGLIVGSFLVIGLVLFSYVKWISPFIGERAAALIPVSIEEQIGESSFAQITSLFEIDSSKTDILTEFYQVCGFSSDYNIRLHFFDNDMVNAFAVPGGQIAIFQGIVDETKCWDELAALIAHEQAHVDHRHSLKIMTRALSSYLVLSLLTGDIGGVSGIVLENVNQFNQLANSREFEKEADLEGLKSLQALKINPYAMSDLMTRLLDYTDDLKSKVKPNSSDSDSASDTSGILVTVEELSSNLEKYMEYMQSHPLTKNRIDYINKIIASDHSYKYNAVDIVRADELWQTLKDRDESNDGIWDTLKAKFDRIE